MRTISVKQRRHSASAVVVEGGGVTAEKLRAKSTMFYFLTGQNYKTSCQMTTNSLGYRTTIKILKGLFSEYCMVGVSDGVRARKVFTGEYCAVSTSQNI